MTMINPDAHVAVGDVLDFEGDPVTVRRDLDTLVISQMTVSREGIARLRKVLDDGEAGILAYRFRTVDLSGIDLDEVSYLLATLGLEPLLEETDWVAAGRRLESGRLSGGYAELAKLHALLAGTGTKAEAGLPGTDLPEACAYHGGEGNGGEFCDECREDQDPFGASAFRGHGPGCGCPDCEGARRDARDGHPDEGGPVFGEAELRRADAYRPGRDEDCGCGLGAERCRRAEDGDFND